MHLRAVMCPTAPDLTSLQMRVPVLPRVLQPRTSPTNRGGLRRCHVTYGSGPCLPAELGSGAAMCPMALDLTSLSR
jgi:hypothetical protein